MSGQFTPLLDGPEPPATHTPPRMFAPAPESHRRRDEDSPWCTCGHLRESCVSDEVRMIWARLLDPSGQ